MQHCLGRYVGEVMAGEAKAYTLRSKDGAERATLLNELYAALHRRLSIFTNLPFDALDRMALKARLDSLGKMKQLPEGIDQANLDFSRQGYDDLSKSWTAAQEDFAAGRFTEAASKANAARRRANDLMARLKVPPPPR